MSRLKRKARNVALSFLRRQGVPETQLAERCKSIGQYSLLGGVLLVVPLLIWELPTAVTVLLQLGYATMMIVGVMLGFDEKKS
ncbi:hypothetical protein DQ91_004354 [Escherichia coli]|uniref:hypothetical protein n=1 Tax=Enterobacteriaceae TaxID=543 RepID=UPI0012D012F8|nr:MULTISPECIES: hypothetical protein [Enterobacteriaceae]EBD1309716.1 hypothetical protein [Salmonella enterica subsp. enterica serovar Mbandaka]ECB6441181.1 hypothetical protein [Salmonella enterica subsp. enterica serovar Typhimurium]EDT2598996.1 hypothetical protein [Salmonella enterica subsp. enterica serovar Havana]EDY5827981.1 hypothetical protein [Salmonella enterica subsp. enterica serovar Senftenberg]EEC0161150.1 hypothetical protein [Salmonella enterica]EFM0047532.1 hypothetical pr